MKQGKLQLGNEAVLVEYELNTVTVNNKRETTGRFILKNSPGTQLSNALLKMAGANLVTDEGKVLWVEFTNNSNGSEIEFITHLPQGFVLNSSDRDRE